MTRRSCALLGALLLVSCASELRQRPVSLDPSNPAAPASPPIMLSMALAEEPPLPPDPKGAAPSHTHSHGAAGAKDGATLYTCPMHPEVVSESASARCPKCGMALVPQKPDAGSPASAHGGHP